MFKCPVHGFAPVCMHSPDLLELQSDGTLPKIVIVEVMDNPEEGAFFRFNVSLAEASKLPVVDGRIPFDVDAAHILCRLHEMCGCCFEERRKALQQLSERRN